MKKTLLPLSMAACALLVSSVSALAGGHDYQITGPVVSATETSIVLQAGKENWEISRDANTKVTGEIKPGNKVTVHYTMTASSVEDKGPAPAKTAGAKKDKPKADKPAAGMDKPAAGMDKPAVGTEKPMASPAAKP
jgi:hypothetical protein